MVNQTTLTESINILHNGNRRSKRVRNAIAYLQAQRREAPPAPIDWTNFHDGTRAVFDRVPLSSIGDFLGCRPPDYVSASGSLYWFNRDWSGVYRLSDHWGMQIRSCDWYLRGFDGQKADEYTTALGYCAFAHFLRDIHKDSRHYLVSADGSRVPCMAGHYLNKAARAAGQTVAEDIRRESFYPGYRECCAVKDAVTAEVL